MLHRVDRGFHRALCGEQHEVGVRQVVAERVTSLPFEVFKTQHFAPSEVRCVVTSADAERRVVQGAVDEVAASAGFSGAVVLMRDGRVVHERAVGLAERDLGPTLFATRPFVVRIGG